MSALGRTSLRMLVLALALAPCTLPAQTGADQQMLTAWQDSVDRANTEAALAPLDPLSRRGAKGDVGDLRRQIFQIRLAEFRGDRQAFELLLDNLDWTSSKHHNWAWPDLLMARVFAAMAIAKMPVTLSTGQRPQEAFSDAVWRHLREAVKIDPELEAARRFAFHLMVEGGERQLRPDQLALLQAELVRPAPLSDALLVWGRDQRRHRHLPEAVVAFQRSAAMGGDSTRLALELARTIRALGDTAAASTLYWIGAERPTATGRAAYRDDLAWILEPDSLAVFDAVPSDSLAPWLRMFWTHRDANSAGRAGDRLLEQLFRWSYVFGRYNAIDPGKRTMYSTVDLGFESGLGPLGFGPGMQDNPVCGQSSVPDFFQHMWHMAVVHAGDLRSREPIIDHRGLLYLRHGEPVRRWGGGGRVIPSDTALYFGGHDPYRDREVLAAQAVRPMSRDVESWLYLVDGAYRLIAFRGSNSLGRYAPTTMGSYVQYDPRQWVAMADYIPVYATGAVDLEAMPAALRGMPKQKAGDIPADATPCMRQFQAGLKRGRSDSRVVIATESKSPPIVHPWASSVQVFALGRGVDNDGKALVTLAMGGKALLPDTSITEGASYNVDFHVVAFDPKSGRTVTLDTTRRFVAPAALTPGQSLSAFFVMPLDAGTWQVAVRANQGADSVGLYTLARDVNIPATSNITLSDIVGGSAGAPTWVATDGERFPVNLFGSWKPGSTVELFYEVHGVPDATEYRASVEVKSTNPKIKQVVRIASTDRASGPVTHVRKSLDLGTLPPGSYLLSVTVESPNGRATRVRPIIIVKP